MKPNLTRKQGIPALASAPHRLLESLSCTLKILNQDAQFKVILEFALPIHGVGDKRLYELHCGGGNLVPGGNSLMETNTPLPHRLYSSQLRYGKSQPRMLSLSLKPPCSLWHPVGHELDADFRKLLVMAQSPTIHILFDITWLAKENYTRLKRILGGSQEFASVPVLEQLKASHMEVPWHVINFIRDAAPKAHVSDEDLASGVITSIENTGPEAPFQDVEHDKPPPYTQLRRKRPRHTNPSSTPDAHDPKRLRENSCSSRESKRANSMASSATVEVDLFQNAVTSAVEKVFLHILKKELPHLVNKELPHALQKVLQEMLAGRPPSRSSSPAPRCTQIPSALTHHDPIPNYNHTLSTMFEKAITTGVRDTVDETFHDTLKESYNLASIELKEFSGELMSQLAECRDDHVVTCNDDLNQMAAGFEQHLAERLNDFQAHAENIELEIMDRLNKGGDTIGSQAPCRRGDLLTAPELSRRATSLPVSNYDKERIAKGA